jgi:hypothetical protein
MHTVQTIDLAAELMAMASTGGPCAQSQASNTPPLGVKRSRAEPEIDAGDANLKKPIREFRPLATHNAAMVVTPSFLKAEAGDAGGASGAVRALSS